MDSTPCDENADCANTDGSYSCTCKQGFTGDGKTCEGMSKLSPRYTSHLLFFSCLFLLYINKNYCNSGLSTFCFSSDLDECVADPSPCDENADCTNNNGSYSCTCKQGFTGSGEECVGM